jgi:hypothetical protein
MEYSTPGIVVSVEQGWSEEEVSKLRKGAYSRLHLTSVPYSRTYDLVRKHTHMPVMKSILGNSGEHFSLYRMLAHLQALLLFPHFYNPKPI